MSRYIKFMITVMMGIITIFFAGTAHAENKRDKQVKKEKTQQVKKAGKYKKRAVKKTVKRRYPKSTVTASASKYGISTGKASWYGPGFHGRLTASGQRFNQNALTAAHKKLPFGTKVRVTNPKNGKSVVVTINDRGPYVSGRVLDLSKGAFQSIASTGSGVITVKYKVLSVGDGKYRLQR